MLALCAHLRSRKRCTSIRACVIGAFQAFDTLFTLSLAILLLRSSLLPDRLYNCESQKTLLFTLRVLLYIQFFLSPFKCIYTHNELLLVLITLYSVRTIEGIRIWNTVSLLLANKIYQGSRILEDCQDELSVGKLRKNSLFRSFILAWIRIRPKSTSRWGMFSKKFRICEFLRYRSCITLKAINFVTIIYGCIYQSLSLSLSDTHTQTHCFSLFRKRFNYNAVHEKQSSYHSLSNESAE